MQTQKCLMTLECPVLIDVSELGEASEEIASRNGLIEGIERKAIDECRGYQGEEVDGGKLDSAGQCSGESFRKELLTGKNDDAGDEKMDLNYAERVEVTFAPMEVEEPG